MGGPYLGSFVSAWLIQAINWQADYGVLAAFYAFSTLLVVFLVDETLYDRHHPQPKARGLKERVLLILGVTGWRVKTRPTIWTITKHTLLLGFRPQILLPC